MALNIRWIAFRVAEIKSLQILGLDFQQSCTPGYYNNEGQPAQEGPLGIEVYTPGINAFNALLQRWREQGDLEGLRLS